MLEDLLFGRGQVVDPAREHVRDPHRAAVGIEQALDVAAEVFLLPRIPGIHFLLMPAADRLLPAAVAADEGAVQDDVRGAAGGQGALQGLPQSRRPGREDGGDLIDVPVGGGLGQAEPGAQSRDA